MKKVVIGIIVVVAIMLFPFIDCVSAFFAGEWFIQCRR